MTSPSASSVPACAARAEEGKIETETLRLINAAKIDLMTFSLGCLNEG
jgi:hypothetical protein